MKKWKNMKKTQKRSIKQLIKNNSKLIIVIILILVWPSLLVYASASGYLFNSDEVSYDNTTSKLQATNVQDALDELYANSDAYLAGLNAAHPIGSIFMTVNSNYNTAAKVGAALGGTWEVFGEGRTLVGLDTGDTSFDTAEETGGAKTHSIEVSNLPVHNHSIPSLSGSTNNTGGHSHKTMRNDQSTSGGTYAYLMNPSGNFAAYITGGSGQPNVYPTTTDGAHSHSVTTTASDTDGCTNCSGTALSTQDKYITVYMYKRTA